MGYSWFRHESSAWQHPKTLALCVELDEPLADAFLGRLWSWTQVYAPDGRFQASIRLQLETALQWRGPAGKLFDSLVKVGLIDADGEWFCVHDWPEMQGGLVEKSKRDAEVKRKKRKKARSEAARAGRSSSARPTPPTRRDVTGRNETDGKKKQGELLPAPVAAPDRPAQRSPRETDFVLDEYAAANNGERYTWQDAKDSQAWKRLKEHATLEQIRETLRFGLRAEGFHRIATVAQLAAKWNDLRALMARPATGPPKKPSVFAAADQPQTHNPGWKTL